jgi:predicted DsbA family dithiol-disulfide isomerase
MAHANVFRTCTIILGLYSLSLTSFVISRAARPDPSELVIEQVDALAAAAEHRGSVLQPADDSANVLTVWTDYECPFCRKLEAALDSIPPSLQKRTRILVRHYPLSFHPNARALAALSICADEAGDFAAVHQRLFERQRDTAHLEFGQSIPGLLSGDSSAIRRCLESDRPLRRIREDSSAAQRFRIKGTPLLLIGRTLVHGAIDARTLDSLLTRQGRVVPRG